MKSTILVTTSIPYVNAAPHLGHALELVQTDTLSRFYRLLNHDVFFLTGTDENAIKNVESAKQEKLTPKELVDKNSQLFLNLKNALNLSFDEFIRTASQRHIQGAQKFWELCKKDIYKKKYEGFYCTGCETFYKKGELNNDVCPKHNRLLEHVSEENYFFSLSRYQDQLKTLIESDTLLVVPSFRKKEVLNFIKSGLEDFSISRPIERTKGWGVPVPNDPKQIMYVWFDALTNYITALGFQNDEELFKKYWVKNENRYHVIGKDIIKFHAIYWPAMLLSAKIGLPNKIFVHGFINIEGKKMSKTIGNIIDPFELVKHYGTDAIRYYLLREIPPFDDGNFSQHRMDEVYKSDLANELGNLVLRITQLAQEDNIERKEKTPKDDERYLKLIKSYQFSQALEYIWSLIKGLNRQVDDFAPWKVTQNQRSGFLLKILGELNKIATLLIPFLPETASTVLNITSGKIRKPPVLFPRL